MKPKIKTRKSVGAALKRRACRSTRKPALKRQHEQRMPRLIPDGVRRLILEGADKLKTPALGGGFTASAHKVRDYLIDEYGIRVSVHPILDELKDAGYKVSRGGRPPNLHTRDRAEIHRMRYQDGMTLAAIGEKLDLSPQRIHDILKDFGTDGIAKK